MDDDELVALVAADLRRNLQERSSKVGDVYGACLWADDLQGDFLFSLGTEAAFEGHRLLPAHAGSEDALRAADGVRWSVGDWHAFPDDDFLSEETREVLEPLVLALDDDGLDDDALDAAAERWRELAFKVLEAARPLDLLPCTDDAVAFVAFGDATVEEQLETMARTIPDSTMRALFPEQ